MKRRGIILNNNDRNEAVSDLIGVVLMVSLVVVGIGIVSVVIVGQDTPVELPSLSMIPDTDGTDLFLYHAGGDLLKRGEFFVRVDGEDYYADDIDVVGQDGSPKGLWSSWCLGECLKIEGKGDYSQILIISSWGGGSIITGSGDAVVTATSTTTATATPTATVTATPTPDLYNADFTANTTSGALPLSVQFTDQSTGIGSPVSWHWNFGDDTISAEQNPVHQYLEFGEYTVSLSVTYADGSDTETKTDYISVLATSTCENAGLTGYYYRNPNFEGPAVEFTSERLKYADAYGAWYYGYESDMYNWPSQIIDQTEYFSVRYEGYFLVDTEDDYTFNLTSDDGSRLWIDDMDEPLIDNWEDHSPESVSSPVHLTEGYHPIRVMMYEVEEVAVLYLKWSSPSSPDVDYMENFCMDDCCYESPEADFEADVTSGSAPLTVTFTDLSTEYPTSWFWDFGDNTNSTEQNPEHEYTSPGTYTVSLRATNAFGSGTETKTDYITVENFPSPAAWWKFDEISGKDVADSSGNDNDGKIKGSVSHVSEGVCGGALYFNGGGSKPTYVEVDDSDTLDAPKYLTYAAWLKPEEPYGEDNFASLICKKGDDYNYELFARKEWDWGWVSQFSFITSDPDYHQYNTMDFDYEYGQWQHIAFVADTDTRTAKLYVNGDYAATLSPDIGTEMNINNGDVTLGKQQSDYGNYYYYKGLMDDVRLYTTALSDEQIKVIYNSCTLP